MAVFAGPQGVNGGGNRKGGGGGWSGGGEESGCAWLLTG